jgi:signal transduction histidine kinase
LGFSRATLSFGLFETQTSSSTAIQSGEPGTGKTASGDVLVAVRDSGPGLALTALERVFDPFYTSKPGGLGMGLSICRSIIEAHGGNVWASDNTPSGAVFHFTLPAG